MLSTTNSPRATTCNTSHCTCFCAFISTGMPAVHLVKLPSWVFIFLRVRMCQKLVSVSWSVRSSGKSLLLVRGAEYGRSRCEIFKTQSIFSEHTSSYQLQDTGESYSRHWTHIQDTWVSLRNLFQMCELSAFLILKRANTNLLSRSERAAERYTKRGNKRQAGKESAGPGEVGKGVKCKEPGKK